MRPSLIGFGIGLFASNAVVLTVAAAIGGPTMTPNLLLFIVGVILLVATLIDWSFDA